MASPYGLLAAGLFFVAVGVGAIVAEQRWPGGILSLILAATLLGFAVRMLASRRSNGEA